MNIIGYIYFYVYYLFFIKDILEEFMFIFLFKWVDRNIDFEIKIILELLDFLDNLFSLKDLEVIFMRLEFEGMFDINFYLIN